MKVIVAGSRSITNFELVADAIPSSKFYPKEIVSGGARGVDSLGERWGEALSIPIKMFHPDWSVGKHAGFIRNEAMAKYADALIAVWDGKSRGTAHMIKTMEALGKPVYVYRPS